MPDRIAIEVDGSAIANVREESIVFVEMAQGGEIGQGGFDLVDHAAAMIPALKDVTAEDSRATHVRLFTGMTGARGLGRGEGERQELQRTWDVTLWDLNSLLDGVLLTGSTWNRPAETDYARITALLAELAAVGISAGVVPNTNTVNMGAEDYRGQEVRRVLSDCGESSQKLYFVYRYLTTGDALLYYDRATGTSLTSGLTLSSDPADVDYVTCWPLVFTAEPVLKLDPRDVYSKARMRYQGGTVTLEDSDIGLTTSTDYRPRTIALDDSTVKSSAKATAKLTQYLTAASQERRKIESAEVDLPAELVNEIRGGQRIHVRIPHLAVDGLDLDAGAYLRIITRETRLQPAEHGVVRDWYRLRLEFADDYKVTSFHDSRPPDSGADDANVEDDAAVALTRYQLTEELGGGPFGPAAGLWYTISPAFTIGTISAAVDGKVSRTPAHNVPWPYTDCGVGTGAVAGLASEAVAHRFTIDLSAGDIVGVRFTVAAFLASGSGYTASPGGFLVGDETVACGIHTGASSSGADFAELEDYTEVGRVGDGGGDVFVPASLLVDVTAGYNWFILAPGWRISSGLLICNSAGNKPWGYGNTGHDSNASSIVSGLAVIASGTGLSPWLPAFGDIDGTNRTFSLPLWNGDGTPELRLGGTMLGAGEYTVDATLLEAELVQAPAVGSGPVGYRARTG
jgi:hypothetical protein